MIHTLLRLRFRSIFAGMTSQGRQKRKSGMGTVILFAVLYLYVGAVMLGAMGFLFYSLAEPYHAMKLDWLYFAMSALMGLGFSILGSVFTTQSQLYDAKDNALLLSMPIPPRLILLSRMIPLLAINLLFSAIVIVPATVVYAVFIECSAALLVGQLLSLIAVTVLSQAIACILGWGLHLLLRAMNKSVASMLYMVVFLVVYFYIYSQMGDIMNSMISDSQAIAGALSWVWPIYALGKGSTGPLLYSLGSTAVCIGCFVGVYAFLSVSFLRSALTVSSGRSRKKLDFSKSNTTSPVNAIFTKELRKFLGTPVYLTNMGLGLVMIAALVVAGLWFRKDILPFIHLLGLQPYVAVLICAIVFYVSSMNCISCPSVSLEGKNLWILKSMPISSKKLLLAKLELHNRLTIPVTGLAGLVLSIAYGCGILDILLCTLACALVSLLIGLIGINAGLKWAKLDYISEAYPCKQSASVMVTIFSSMGIPLILGLVYGFWLANYISPTLFLVISIALMMAVCYGFYKLLTTWGVKKWDSLI